MALYSCDILGCAQPGVRQKACLICNRRLCATHLKPEQHTCPTWETDEDGCQEASARAEREEINTLIARINIGALTARASALRGGIPCTVPPLAYEPDALLKTMGGINYHVNVEFEDGVAWFCRIRRRNASSHPVELQNHGLLSEAATLRFLATTSVPVPKVHDIATDGPENPVGVGYILMDKLAGTPMIWEDLNDDGKKKILEQLADIFIELARYPFPDIGCLDESGSLSVGPLVSESAAKRDALGQLHLLGPFARNLDYRKSIVSHHLDMIRSKETYPSSSADAYLVHRYLLDCLAPLMRYRESDDQGMYYLKHMDDKGDHILVDDALNIVGIIDWEWAQTTSKREAFAAPIFLLDVQAFYEGRNELSPDEEMLASILEDVGAEELAAIVRDGRIEHRLAFCVGGTMDDVDSFPALFVGFRRELGCAKHEDTKEEWEFWQKSALSFYKDDAVLLELMRESDGEL
ncbi:uncharacterized protein LAESUDRAFT_680190 [Laetiporus sulphureus 93-53]|uniref:Aminoglycoside phosphotransferase domain-containing protein n=1 Tax=Laetiporus sulphureus 93-53 TaxID=1314785 RepID=A0A165E2R3_9APHY|nr:uncharacterized protein LAESUDRAFT_680190 [Laetiporus sulphureus 93-53]KZT06134.1 hypothetical protein LAESUDRAFT_680190 [Laetiporus sulphureus 93-53]